MHYTNFFFKLNYSWNRKRWIECSVCHRDSRRIRRTPVSTYAISKWRRQGARGEASPLWVDVQKLCNICVLSLSWNFFVSHDKYIAGPSSRATLIHRQYNRDWGTSYSRPPIDPYLTPPLLQNPGGATAISVVQHWWPRWKKNRSQGEVDETSTHISTIRLHEEICWDSVGHIPCEVQPSSTGDGRLVQLLADHVTSSVLPAADLIQVHSSADGWMTGRASHRRPVIAGGQDRDRCPVPTRAADWSVTCSHAWRTATVTNDSATYAFSQSTVHVSLQDDTAATDDNYINRTQ